MERLSKRIDKRLDKYPTAASALDDMERLGCRLIDEMYAATAGLLDDHCFDLCVVPMATAWMALAPANKRLVIPPGLARSCLEELRQEMDRLAKSASSAADLSGIFRKSRNPELVMLLWEQLTMTRGQLSKKERPTDLQYANMQTVLFAAVNVLAQALENR